jgi:hypothetical protein
MSKDGDPAGGRDQDDKPVPGLAALRTPRAPAQDLWPGIESRIRARRASRLNKRLAGLGAVAAALLLTLGVVLERGGWQERPALASAQVPMPAQEPAQTASAQPRQDPDLLPAVAHLHPETRALLKANLKIVASAETQLRRALNSDPDAEYLKSLLASTRQQKQELHGVLLADSR